MSEDQKAELAAEKEQLQAKADETNKGRSGVGTRVFVGSTRGRNTMNITYEAFDLAKPDTLPGSLAQFTEVTGVTDEAALLGFLIDGYNDFQYRQASDPIAEFVNPAWPDDVQASFRITVRNYAKMLETSIEDAASLIKSKLDAKYA